MKTKTRLHGIGKWPFIIILVIYIFISCSKDDQTDEPKAFLPQIEILSPTSTDITVEPMELVVLNIVAAISPGSSEKLVQFKFTRQFEFEAPEVLIDTVPDTNTFSLTNYSMWAEPRNGTEVWTFEAKDESGDVTKKTITLTIDGEIPDLNPQIVLKSGNHPGTGWIYVDGDVTLGVGAPFVFGFDASTNSLSKLKRVKVTRNYENVSLITLLDSSFSLQTISFDIQTIAYPSSPGNEVFEITATDEDDNANSISFTDTTLQQDPGINHFQNIQLGSFTSTISSPFSTTTGQTYTLTQLQDPTLQSKIDWVYFHGVTYGHTLMSPVNSDVYAIYPYPLYQPRLVG